MRRTLVLLFLIVLLVGACAEPAVPTASPPAVPPSSSAPSPASTEPTPTPAVSLPATDPAPSPTVTLAPTATEAQPEATRKVQEAEPEDSTEVQEPAESEGGSPWPALIRELDIGVPAGNSYAPRALGVHSELGRVFARTNSRGEYPAAGLVVVLDPSTGEVSSLVETGIDSHSEGGLVVDGTRDRVYVLNPGESTATVLDASSLETLATLEHVDLLAYAAGDDRVYVTGAEGLRVLDAETGEQLAEAPLPEGQKLLALAVDPAAGRLYLAQQDSDGYRLGLYDAATLEGVATVPLPGWPDGLLADRGRGWLYVTASDSEHYWLWILDSDGAFVDEIDLGDWLQKNYLALDGEGGRLFLGRDDYGNHGIGVLDLDSLVVVTDIALKQSPQALAWDGEAQMLYASHTYANQITAIDPEAGDVSGPYPTALELVDLAVDAQRGHVLLTDSIGRLHVLDSDSDEVLTILPAEGMISVDAAHGRVYTGGAGADRVRIFDSDALEQSAEIRSKALPVADAHSGGLYLVREGIYIASLETLTTTGVISDTLPQNPGYSPNPSATRAEVDPGSGRIFAVIYNGIPGSNGGTNLHVYEAETYERTLADSERSPIYIDIDPETGRAYVSRIHMQARSTSIVEDGRAYSARLDSIFGSLRVDPELERVYLTVREDDEGRMFILDAESLDALDSLPIEGGFSIRALDPARHLLYLATQSGRIQIWSATGGGPPLADDPETADLAAEGAYRLYAPPGGDRIFATDGGYRLYRSDDKGRTWEHPQGGLPDEWVLDVVFAPGYPKPPVLFAALVTAEQGYGVWMSADGGDNWRMVSQGLADLAVTDLAISPAFASDATLFAGTRKGGLHRSTDSGRSWKSLASDVLPGSIAGYQPADISVSPAFANDRTLFVNQAGLWRSTDGGDSWTEVPGPQKVAFSPAFASDGTLFGWTYQGGMLKSLDGGDTWIGASNGLLVPDSSTGQVMVAPDYASSETLYLTLVPTMGGVAPVVYRSTDGAAAWERASDDLQAETPFVLAQAGSELWALDDQARLMRLPVDELDWQPSNLPPIGEIPVHHLALSPNFGLDQTLVAFSEGAGVLRAEDGGLTWKDTRFPLRFDVRYGVSAGLEFTPPDRLWTGSPNGLYRSDGGGPWTAVGGGLPESVSTGSPRMGPDMSLRVLVGREAVYASTDGGDTWEQTIPDLPYDVDEDGLFLSPAFATDRTGFVFVSWEEPQRSLGGGAWEAFGPPGDERARGFHLSPDFDEDGLMFLALDDGSLWRSMGAPGAAGGKPGDEWVQIPPPEEGVSLENLIFSWAYDEDGILFARGDGDLYRSTDAGSTWKPVLDLGTSYIAFEFAPGYGTNGEIYLHQQGTLYHSADRGSGWGAMHDVPWTSSAEVDLLMSPDYDRDRVLLAWTSEGRYQTDDDGDTWVEISEGLPDGSVRQIVFSPEYGTDGLMVAVGWEKGIYKRVGNGPWMPITADVPPPVAAVSTATPTLVPTRLPPPAATPTGGSGEPGPLHDVWQVARARMGAALAPAEPVYIAEQPFQRGTMIWDSTGPAVYVLLDSGTWQVFEDTFRDGVDLVYDTSLPPPPEQPQRGFGKVWREQLGGPDSEVGWALDGERGVDGWRQPTEHAILFWTDAMAEGSDVAGTAYVLFDDGTWAAMSAPAR